jgi:hypothetical protein
VVFLAFLNSPMRRPSIKKSVAKSTCHTTFAQGTNIPYGLVLAFLYECQSALEWNPIGVTNSAGGHQPIFYSEVIGQT